MFLFLRCYHHRQVQLRSADDACFDMPAVFSHFRPGGESDAGLHSGAGLSESRWGRATLPTIHGGLKWRYANEAADAAYCASRAMTGDSAESIYPHPQVETLSETQDHLVDAARRISCRGESTSGQRG